MLKPRNRLLKTSSILNDYQTLHNMVNVNSGKEESGLQASVKNNIKSYTAVDS